MGVKGLALGLALQIKPTGFRFGNLKLDAAQSVLASFGLLG